MINNQRLSVLYFVFREYRKRTVKNKSSHQRCSLKKVVLRNLTKFTGKHLCQGLFFDKVAGLRPATLLKKRRWRRCFPVKSAKFLRTHFLQNTSGRLLLEEEPTLAFCGVNEMSVLLI